MGIIKIGSSNNKKGITINPSIVLFNNKNVKKIMHGTTKIWDDIKALVPTMTSNTTPYGEVSFDSSRSGDAFYVFDKTNNKWVSANLATTGKCYVQYKFDSPVNVQKVGINDYWNATNPINTCKDFIVQGSNDGSTFDDIYTGTHTQSVDDTTLSIYEFENEKYYLYYRFKIISVGTGASYGALTELQFYGKRQ